MTATRPCPACGFQVFAGTWGSLERCPVCGWVDDLAQLVHPDVRVGANDTSLRELQRRLLAAAPEAAGYARDPAWRPLRPGEHPPEPGFSSPVCSLGTPDPEDFAPYWLSPR